MSANQLFQTYLAYLGRPPDSSGLSFYANASEASVVAEIAVSSEAVAMPFRNTASLIEQVNGVYAHLFGRQAETEGLSYWIRELEAGRLSTDQLALAVLNSARNEDALVIANKLETQMS